VRIFVLKRFESWDVNRLSKHDLALCATEKRVSSRVAAPPSSSRKKSHDDHSRPDPPFRDLISRSRGVHALPIPAADVQGSGQALSLEAVVVKGKSAVFSITWKETTTAVAADPTIYEETLRSGASKTFA
jgi:hypothetical protein